MNTYRIVIWLAVFLMIAGNAGAGQDHELKMGVVPYKSPRSIVMLYSPIAVLLSRSLGRDVRVVTTNSFNQYLQRIYKRQYDIIVLGSTFYFKAHDRAHYRAVARGYPPFRCGIIVRKDSGITKLGQLRGKRMAAVNSMDRGGYRLQARALRRAGIDPDTDVVVDFRGKHDSVIYSVLNGQDDAGAIRLDTLDKEPFAAVRDTLRIIFKSPENPQFPFAVRPGIPVDMREKIGATLASITMANPETATILRNLHILGIELITDEKLEELRQQRLVEEKGM